jgi:LemA protein
MKKGCLVGIILAAVVLILVAWAVSGYNSLVGLSQGVDGSWAQVQNAYQRRADLIPNLVQTVQGAANFEKSTITEVTNARASVGSVKINPNTAPTDPQALQQFQAAQGQLSSALSRLLVVAERYPELRATQNFRDLQVALEGSENRIAVERGRFNERVQEYNTRVRRFPAVFYAGLFGFQPKPYFAAEGGAEKAPQVRFDFGSSPTTQP